MMPAAMPGHCRRRLLCCAAVQTSCSFIWVWVDLGLVFWPCLSMPHTLPSGCSQA